MCNSGSLGKGKVVFRGRMGTGIYSGTSYMLLTQKNATVGVFNYFEAPGPLGVLALGPWSFNCAQWWMMLIVIIWPGYRYLVSSYLLPVVPVTC